MAFLNHELTKSLSKQFRIEDYLPRDEHVLNHLSKYSGKETISNLVDSKKISYSNMKKILHDMNKGELNEEERTWFKI